MEDNSTIIISIVSALFGGAFVVIFEFLIYRKRRYLEIKKLKAETDKIYAETDSIRKNIEGIESEQDQVGNDLEMLKFLIASMLSTWELDMLYKVKSTGEYIVDTNTFSDTFRRDLGDLWGRGFIKQRQPGHKLPWRQGKQNVKIYYEIDDLGRQYLKLREHLLKPVKPDTSV